MKRYFLSAVATAVLGVMSAGQRADAGQLSPERLNVLDQRGYFTPEFKQATHALVDAKHALEQASAEQKTLTKQLPGLQQQAAEAAAKAVALRQDLKKYDHPEENDFDALQAAINDAAAKTQDQIILAQAYVWAYPTSPHAADAQQYLTLALKKRADQVQADKDAEAARAAARADLVARAQAHNLSLAEWRGFLRGMSQDDLGKLLGQPSSRDDQYWYYVGGWVNKPDGKPKVGLQINFDAGRVITVDEKPSLP
jgi:hypothetical protein